MTFVNADAYERQIGRWSRLLAPLLIDFVEVDDGSDVLDVGCGTGALSFAVAFSRPNSKVVGIDLSPGFVEEARKRDKEARVRFEVGDAQKLAFPNSSFDRTFALLVINHVPNARLTISEMVRVTRPRGMVGAAVWDYGDGMKMMKTFWDAAAALDPSAEGHREKHMRYSRKGELSTLWTESGLEQVRESGLTIPMSFSSFDDFFKPFLEGIGPAGSYATGLSPAGRAALREKLFELVLGTGPDQPFTLPARAWAVQGTVP